MKTQKRFLPTLTLCLGTVCALTTFTALGADPKIQEIWDKQCASCHGKDGKGETKMGKKVDAKDYTDPKVQAEIKDDTALEKLKNGITEKGKERMKPFKEKLTEDEMKALIAHIRTLCKK